MKNISNNKKHNILFAVVLGILLFGLFSPASEAATKEQYLCIGQKAVVEGRTDWKSSDKTVVKITKKGKAKGKSEGTATLSAPDGAKIKVRVCEKGKTFRLKKGKKKKLPGKIVDIQGKCIKKYKGKKIKAVGKGTAWVFTRENGKVTGHKVTVGKAHFSKARYFVEGKDKTSIPVKLKSGGKDVKYRYDDYYILRNKKTDTWRTAEDCGFSKITARTENGTASCMVFIGNVLPYTTYCGVGRTESLYWGAKIMDGAGFKIKVSDPSVATVSDRGVVHGKKCGITTISAKIGSKTFYGTVVVGKQKSYLKIKKLSDYKPYVPGFLYKAAVDYGVTYNVVEIIPYLDNPEKFSGLFHTSKWECPAIYVSDTSSQIAMHELGHFVDYIADDKNISGSSSDEWKSVWKKEKSGGSLYTGYSMGTGKEFFAESFWLYIENPVELRGKYPETFAFMENLLGKLEKVL